MELVDYRTEEKEQDLMDICELIKNEFSEQQVRGLLLGVLISMYENENQIREHLLAMKERISTIK